VGKKKTSLFREVNNSGYLVLFQSRAIRYLLPH